MNRRLFLELAAAGTIGGTLSRRASASQPPTRKTFTYKTVGGCAIRADVYGATPDAKNPTLMWIHGGALISGSRGLGGPFTAKLLESGWSIVTIDYRLAPETKLPGIIEDVQDAWRWVREQASKLGLDTDRMAVAGGSAGGYLTLMAGFCLDPRPRALVSYYGYGDITAPWYADPNEFYRRKPLVSKDETYRLVGTTAVSVPPAGSQRGQFYVYCRQNGLWPKEVAGHDPHTEPRWFDPYCPIRNVSANYPPTLLIHGTKDTDVPYSESKNMADRLAAAGVRHELITVEGGGHGLGGGDPELLSRIPDRAVEFLNAETKRL